VRLVGLRVSAPGATVTVAVLEVQFAASLTVIVAVAGVVPFLLPFTGVTVSVACCVPALVIADAVTVATVVSLDVAVTVTGGPGSVTVMFCVAVVPLNVSEVGLSEIGPFTLTDSKPVSPCVLLRFIEVEPVACPVTVKVEPLGALVGLTVATEGCADEADIAAEPCMAVNVPVPPDAQIVRDDGLVLMVAASATSELATTFETSAMLRTIVAMVRFDCISGPNRSFNERVLG
jgi:hypothetical protein